MAKKFSKSWKNKISKSVKKLWNNSKFREKILAAQRKNGNKISKWMKNNWKNEEYRNNILTKVTKTRNEPKNKKRASINAKKLWKSAEHRKKISKSIKKKWKDPKFKKEMKKSLKDSWKNNDERKSKTSNYMRKCSSKMWKDQEYRNKQSKSRVEAWKSRKRINQASIVTSISSKKRWKDPEYQKKMAKAFNLKPNKAEQTLDGILKEVSSIRYKYVGDFKKFIGNKNPDFINTRKKKIIELFGKYWHNRDIFPNKSSPRERKRYFKRYGFDTLIIGEKELKPINRNRLVSKISKFNLK